MASTRNFKSSIVWLGWSHQILGLSLMWNVISMIWNTWCTICNDDVMISSGSTIRLCWWWRVRVVGSSNGKNMYKLQYYHLLNQNKVQLLFYQDKNVEHWSYYKVMHLSSFISCMCFYTMWISYFINISTLFIQWNVFKKRHDNRRKIKMSWN